MWSPWAWLLLAIGNLVMGLRGDLPARAGSDPKAIARILGGLAILIAIIGFGGGFILATTILFAMTAAAFGRRAFLADLAIGFVLAFVIYLMFDKVLTLSLPAGPLERLFDEVSSMDNPSAPWRKAWRSRCSR